jgi:hypothetical protein
MQLTSIILLIVSIMLVFMSLCNLSVFNRFHVGSENGITSCNVSKHYAKSGRSMSIIMLIVSLFIMIISSILIYLGHNQNSTL